MFKTKISYCLKYTYRSRAWWHTPLIPALGRQRQVDFWVRGQPGLQSEFQDSQSYTEKPCLEKKYTYRRDICTCMFINIYAMPIFAKFKFFTVCVSISQRTLQLTDMIKVPLADSAAYEAGGRTLEWVKEFTPIELPEQIL